MVIAEEMLDKLLGISIRNQSGECVELVHHCIEGLKAQMEVDTSQQWEEGSAKKIGKYSTRLMERMG